jgi:murein tripeptide amidase MpaA
VQRLLALVFCLVPVPALAQDAPRTVAERTDYRETSRHADVTAFCEALAKQSPLVRLTDFGASTEGRKLHLLVLSDPPVSTPEEAAESKKPVVLAFANIHAGEVDGKEAVLALARDLAAEKELLKKLVVLIVPNLNPDGNEKIDPKNRTSQNGPPTGVGTRANAQGFDLNRDFVKLESPEIRGLARVFNEWNPLLVVDCHTTNGSYHRYTLTYDGPRYPAADPRLVEAGQEKVLPDLAARMKKATGVRLLPIRQLLARQVPVGDVPVQPAVQHAVPRAPRPGRPPVRVVHLRPLRRPGEGELRLRPRRVRPRRGARG